MNRSEDDTTDRRAPGEAESDRAGAVSDDETTLRRTKCSSKGAVYGEEAEPTHLITFDDDEPTHLITFDDEPEPAHTDDDSTHLITFDDDEATTGRRLTDPTLPTDADRGQELPRYVTGKRDHSGDPSLPGFENFLASAHLDLDDSAPSFDVPPDSSPPVVRRFTVMVRDRAQTHLEDLLDSPRRAFILATTTAGIILLAGALLIYSALGHAHLDDQLQRAERAIDADLYSSHLAALRDLRALPDHQVLPLGPVDRAVSSLVDRLPLLSLGEKKERALQLRTFVEARLDYRFEAPETHLEQEISDPSSEILAAAAIYQLLSTGDHRRALPIGDDLFAGGIDDRIALLAYGDLLADSGDEQRLNLVAETFPTRSAAETLVAARLQQQRGQTDRARALLEHLVEYQGALSVTAALDLAELISDPAKQISLVQDFTDPDHDHAAPVERARAMIILANADAELQPDQRKRLLANAADLAPLRPEAVSPYIDFLHQSGELLEARSHLLRTPSRERRHRYFDIATARNHLLLGDLDRAKERLLPYVFDDRQATLFLAITHGLNDEFNESTALFDTLREEGVPIAEVGRTWVEALQGYFDEEFSEGVEVDDLILSPFDAAFFAETLLAKADLAPSRSARNHLLTQVESLLDNSPVETPEIRRAACRLALDLRRPGAAQEACSHLATRDTASRRALATAIRWQLYEGDLPGARRLLDQHISAAGPASTLRLIDADLHLRHGDADQARALLAEAPSELHFTAQYQLMEAKIAVAQGRYEEGAQYFAHARRASQRYRPEAALGHIGAQLRLLDDSAQKFGDNQLDGDEVDPDGQWEEDIRMALRHGEFGPRAWTLFAQLRRLQGRLSDAHENLSFAERARRDFGPDHEKLALLEERRRLLIARHGPDHRRVETLAQQIEEFRSKSTTPSP